MPSWPSFRPTAIIRGVSGWFRTYGFADVLDELLLIGASRSTQTTWGCSPRMRRRPGAQPGRGRRVPRRASAARVTRRLSRRRDRGAPARRSPTSAVYRPTASRRPSARCSAGSTTALVVYVHCRAGWQRSAAVAAGVVADREDLDIDGALGRASSGASLGRPAAPSARGPRWWWARSASRAELLATPSADAEGAADERARGAATRAWRACGGSPATPETRR